MQTKRGEGGEKGGRKKAVSTNAISIRLSMDGKKYGGEGGGRGRRLKKEPRRVSIKRQR